MPKKVNMEQRAVIKFYFKLAKGHITKSLKNVSGNCLSLAPLPVAQMLSRKQCCVVVCFVGPSIGTFLLYSVTPAYLFGSCRFVFEEAENC